MNRLLLILLLPAVGTLRAAEFQPLEKPNVILFLVDDMGWMDCEPYGSAYYDTPNMTRLAKQGMRFTQAYAQPLCSPTRASLLTGQHSARHGVTSATGHLPPQPAGQDFLPPSAPPDRPLLMPESRNYLEPSHYTLAEALRDAGYRTGHFGKWHLGLTQPHWPEQQGFEVAFHCEPSAGPPNAYFSPYSVAAPGADAPKVKSARQVVGTITDGPKGEYITDRLTDEALKFIAASRRERRPFFLNLWHYGVHGPWGHKESLTAALAQRTDPRGVQGNAVMASMLKSVDESLGRILDQLDDLQLAENTIIIFTSDNGGNTHSMTKADGKASRQSEGNPTIASYRKWAGFKPPTSNAPLRDGKGRLYEGGVRVPLMVRWPGRISAGSTSDAIVGCVDLYPTVLAMAGLPADSRQRMDGVSYASILLGTGELNRDAYFIWFPHLVPGVAVRQGDWKLIRRFEERPDEYEGTHELFNLRDDLGEATNLAGTMPDKVKELDALIDAFVKDTRALYPRPNPAFQPRRATEDASPKPGADRMAGLVPRFCKAAIADGALRIEADGRTPFLGTAQIRAAGPLVLKLRARSPRGGTGKVQWTTQAQDDFPASGQSVEFPLAARDDWQDLAIHVPVDGETRIVRLYLPADLSPVDVHAIEWFKPGADKPLRTWYFSAATP
jgi:arylsulfatase A-like enzyme